MARIIIILIILLPSVTLQAQKEKLKFEHITVDQGLSQSTGRVVFQDSKGFIWIGTQDGLNKYDGYGFKVYEHDPLDKNSLSDNFIFSIYEDKSGFIWVGTNGGGLNKFDPEKEKFERYKNDPNNPNSLSHNVVNTIYEDKSRTLWVGTNLGLNKLVLSEVEGFERENDKFGHYLVDTTNLNLNSVTSIFEDSHGEFWIGTIGSGLNKFNREKEEFTRFVNNPDDPKSLSSNVVQSIYEDRYGVFWIGTAGGGLNKLDREKQEFTRFVNNPDDPKSLSHNNVWTIYEDNSGTLWIGTQDGGLNKLDRKGETFLRYLNDPNNPNSLNNNIIFSILEDRSGSIWVGTGGGGINKFERQKERFMHYKNDPSKSSSSLNNFVWAIEEDNNGALWIGTQGGGLYHFDRSKEEFTVYINDPSDPNTLSNNIILAIHQSQDGTFWIGTNGGGLNKLVPSSGSGQALSEAERLDKNTGKFIRYLFNPCDPKSLGSNVVRAIYEDKDGTLWLGTYGGGLNKFVPSSTLRRGSGQGSGQALSPTLSPALGEARPERSRRSEGEFEGLEKGKEEFKRYQNDPNNPNSLSSNTIFTIYEDQFGMLWVGTWGGGLNKLDKNTEQFTRYLHDPSNPNSLSHDRVRAVHEDHSGTLWLGTDRGLNKLDREKNQFEGYTKKDGLPDDVIYAILSDDHGNLWLSTNKGLSKFNPQTKEFKNYDVYDGLQSNEFNTGAFHKTKNGELIFGGINGFNIFHPDSVKDNPHIPPIVLTAFRKFGKEVKLEKAISEIDHIKLSYKDDFFSFEFAALDYINPMKNQYAYKLEGFNKDWIHCGNRRIATYTRLDPGDYIFRVKGSNNDGVWNEEGTSIRITITPPFWKTMWFFTSSALSLMVVGYTVYRGRVNAKLEKARILNELKAAHDMQMGLMPTSDPIIQGFDISGICIPAEEVGGDYFDYVWLDEKKSQLGIAIVDVSDKAMKGAMTAVMTSGMVYSEVINNQSPGSILRDINRPMYLKSKPQTFTAMSFAVIDNQSKILTFATAGQPHPILKRNGKIQYIKVDGTNFPLGVQEDVDYGQVALRLQSGDVVIFYTDGLPDAMNEQSELFDFERMETTICNLQTSIRSTEVVKTLLNAVEKFTGTTKPHDDITVVVVRVV